MRHTPIRAAEDFESSISEAELSYEVQVRRTPGTRWERFDGSHDLSAARAMKVRALQTNMDHEVRMIRTSTIHKHHVIS